MTRREIAPDVFWLPLGRRWRAVNAYLVRSASSWALVDAGWKGDAAAIATAARTILGADTPAASILLTHVHPDHSGAARELARLWQCRVWVHPRELPLALGRVEALRHGSGPLDRWLILPSLRAGGRRRMEAMLARGSLADVVETFGPGEEPPGLPGWRVLQTPGHTPGHVAFLRPRDGVVLTGDAMTTVELNSIPGLALGTRRLSAAPWITTWDWTSARASAAAIGALQPSLLAGGHGEPMSAAELEEGLRSYRERS
jgi:glyoxylase-like metal-dependent hydrolase (beta-lactamase superfamily II)